MLRWMGSWRLSDVPSIPCWCHVSDLAPLGLRCLWARCSVCSVALETAAVDTQRVCLWAVGGYVGLRAERSCSAISSTDPSSKTRVPDSSTAIAVRQGSQKRHRLSPELHNRVTKTVAKTSLHSFHLPWLLSSPWLMSSFCADCVSPSCLYRSAQCPCLVSQLLHVIKSSFGDPSVAEWRSFSLPCQDTHQS